MAYAVTHTFKDTTKDQYDAAVGAVHPKDGLPPGQNIHVAGITEGGDLVILAVFDSKAAWESFRDGTLVPGLSGLENGPSAPPEEVGFEVYNLQTA